ncbi:MAG: fumarylacetoacetate hydrolase family protein [Planctomycetota bacterium]|nr:fumarylacetoacetate hydrolase family protein [Planctomycetota bacterium]
MSIHSQLRNVFCLGKNFAAHARELNSEPPSTPLWFNKLPNIFIGDGDFIHIPQWLTSRVDCEAEVAIQIGDDLRDASAAECEAAITGYTCANDITARDVQSSDRQSGMPWLRSKNIQSFGVLGPRWADYPGAHAFSELQLTGRLNSEIVQQALLGEMIFNPGEALSEISRWHQLSSGDVLLLGTPQGVCPIADGDTLEVSCGDLSLSNRVSQA